MPEPKTSRRKIIAAERVKKAFEMRKAGANYSQIAEKLGVSPQAAHKSVMKWFEKNGALIESKAEDVRRIEIERLDSMLLGIWQGAATGDPVKIDRAIKIMERRARLLGLDMPQKIDVTNHEDTLNELE